MSEWTGLTLSKTQKDRNPRGIEEADCQVGGTPAVYKTTGQIDKWKDEDIRQGYYIIPDRFLRHLTAASTKKTMS